MVKVAVPPQFNNAAFFALYIKEELTIRKDKKLQYAERIYPAIHTLSGVSDQELTIDENSYLEAIRNYSTRKKRNQDKTETFIMLNPNKINPHEELFKTYSELDAAVCQTLESVGITKDNYEIRRIDLCFNSENPEDFLLYQKLHKLLICCLADCYKVKNCYNSFDLWSFNPLSIAVKNDDFEIENYDKQRESNNTSTIKNRLELRSKRVKDDPAFEFLVRWRDRLDKAVGHFETVQTRFNENLEKIYKDDLAKQKKDRKFLNRNSFLLQYSDCIFTRRQLVDLMKRLGEAHPEDKAKSFKRFHRIEFFSLADLKFVVKTIQTKSEEFFNS